MAHDELDKVELPAIAQLKSLGWSYVEGADLSPDDSDERSSFKEVVLEKRLTESIQRINPWISSENCRKVVSDLTKTPYTNLVEANKDIWEMINQCATVMQDVGRGNQGQTVHIIDFKNPENNEFLCTNQFKISGIHQNIIPDIVLFVNGLPLAVIECKSPYITNPMESGINQLLRYANRRTPENNEGAEKLFHYNLMMVSTHRDSARVGTISSRMEHYLEWKDPYPLPVEELGAEPSSQEVLIAGLFSKANFLDVMQNFTVFDPVDGRIIKKIPRYQQFRAVHKTIERIKTGSTPKERSGVIWHTQGSGKSLTMVFLAIKMRRDPDLQGYKLVFLTDRRQLDNQLTTTFKNAQDETVHNADSIKDLLGLLSSDGSDIVTATVQKFQERGQEFNFPELNASEKILVIADEAHRTQYGTFGAAMYKALPNAPRIAFTGTPLIRTRKTENAFGSFIDTYRFDQAVEDDATVQILYEGREPIVKVTADSLDSLFDEYFADSSEEERAEMKRKYGTRKAVQEASQRIRRICMDIIKHYREFIQPNGFKAMVVTPSRRAALIYKEQLDKLNGPQSAVIISGDHNDPKEFWEHIDGDQQKTQINDFKKPLGNGDGQSPLSFLIVKDMLLTGFDAPVAQVMYLDRKLMDHTLLQAIARVNRVNENKFRGYIVDYYGLSDYLEEALEMFSAEDVQGALLELKDEIPKLENAHTRALKHFEGMDLDDLDACILSLEDEIKRQVFHTDFRIFSMQMDVVLPNPIALDFKDDLVRLGKIVVGARNRYRDEQLDISGAGEKVRELIDEHVRSTGIDPVIPPVKLLAKDYNEQLNQIESPQARASEIEHAIRHHLRVHVDEDPEYYQGLSDKLQEIIDENEERWDHLVQLLLDLRDGIEPDHQQQAQDLDLTQTQLAFYNIVNAELARTQGRPLDDQEIEKITTLIQSLTTMLTEATAIVDFFDKQYEVRRVRRDIRMEIIEHFGEEVVGPITDRFMDLVEVHFS